MFPALAELEDGPHLRFYWWIEGLLNRLFVWAFDGSREEEQDALELAYGAELDRYSPRQQAIIEKHYLVYRETDTRRLLPEHASS
jgi:hypothetical protein